MAISNRPKLARYTPLLIFLLAMAARLAAIGRYVTPDELIWVQRSLGFRQALLAGDWANTIQSGHPGVVTTWLGALAIQLQLWLRPELQEAVDWLAQLYWLSPDNGEALQRLALFLMPARLAVAGATSLGLVAIYRLAVPRLGRETALLGALLLALDPFTAGLSGLLHVDALLGTFMLITLLLLLPAGGELRWPAGRRYLLLAGLTTGLAILAKSPGLYLLGLVPLVLLWRWGGRFTNRPYGNRPYGVLSLGRAGLVWGGAALLTMLLLLPALWAAPGQVVELTFGLAERLVDSAVRPTFFLGEVTLEPGGLFYPLAILLRLSPAVLVGLVAALVRAWRGRVVPVGAVREPPLQEPPPQTVFWLFLAGLGFVLFLNLSAKRFDRYALPALMPWIMLAGWGLAQGGSRTAPTGAYWRRAAVMGVVVLHAVYALVYWPYPLTAYNWLAGGPAVAAQVLPVGWGEETGAAARWAAEQPGAEERVLYAGNVPAAAAFYPGPLARLTEENLVRLQAEDWLLFDSQSWQFEADAFGFSGQVPQLEVVNGAASARTWTFKGLPRAAIYSGLRATEVVGRQLIAGPAGYRFNNILQINAAGALPDVWPGAVLAVIEWQALQPAAAELQLRLVDEAGRVRLAQLLPLLDGTDRLPLYWPAGEGRPVYYRLPLEPDLPPGRYSLQAAVFDAAGAQQGVFDGAGRFQGTAAGLATLTIPAPAEQLAIEIPNRVDGVVELAGFGALPGPLGTGERLELDLWWRQGAETAARGRLVWLVDGREVVASLETVGWAPGQIYHLIVDWRVPADLPPGSYPVDLQWQNETGRPLWPEPVRLGEVAVKAVEREFELPAGIEPLGVQLGGLALLQQAALAEEGGQILIDTTWQVVAPDGKAYTVFVHLRDEEGNILAQDDRPPRPASDGWAAGQVINDRFTLPRPEAGRYTIALGFYDPASGLRLPLFEESGEPLAGDQYLLDLVLP